MKMATSGRIFFARLCVAVLAAGIFSLPLAITRWSTLQAVPNADMLPGGKFVVDADLAWSTDSFSFTAPRSVQRLHLGLSEWVGLDIGYASGFTMGMKACVLKEDIDAWYLPTLTLGFQNINVSRESHYFESGNDYPRNEFYAVAAKSSEWARVRIHAGFVSTMSNRGPGDAFNPFAGLEKYFGDGLYVTIEAQRRSDNFLLSAFAVYRAIPDKLEFNLGIIDAMGLGWRDWPNVIRPVVRAGIKVHLGSGFHGFDGLTGVEDRIDRQRETIRALDRRIDSLTGEVRWSADRIHELSGFPDNRAEERARVVDELTKLRNLYELEPFNPELVRNTVDQIKDRYEMFAPHLRVIITDPDADPRIRRLAVSLIGEIGDRSASNILMSILERFEEPALKIETMIALGKLGETRARPMLSRLRNDPDSGVAFTAREVHRSMFGTEDEDAGSRSIPVSEEDPIGETVPERRLGR
ncbi:MAG: HEAT repeat domain-containing protein [Chitinispirillales bacterium]|jgi:hypothetical protein|nr:HEAT repeat domain-containing protein [Chitinispirillales bacterium]